MKNVLFAAGLCFVVTELSGLIISIIPIHSFLRSSSFIRTFLVVVFVTGIPTVMFALATSVMTRWLHIKKKAGILGYLLSTAIISALYLAIFPRLLYFQVPQIPDYRLMTGKHYFLWVSAIIAAMIGTWVTNNYWRGIFAQQRLSEGVEKELGTSFSFTVFKYAKLKGIYKNRMLLHMTAGACSLRCLWVLS